MKCSSGIRCELSFVSVIFFSDGNIKAIGFSESGCVLYFVVTQSYVT